MEFDLPHMLVTALLILGTFLVLQRVDAYKNGSRGKRAAISFAALFVVLLLLNLIWPYGA